MRAVALIYSIFTVFTRMIHEARKQRNKHYTAV